MRRAANRSRRGGLLLPAVVFLLLSVIMTWPQAVHLASHVKDDGDPLLNTWIMTWDVKKLTHLELGDLFDANIFYPHHRTLAFSEHLVPEAIVAAPFLLLSSNPIFAYNVVFLLAFATSGLGMYLFARFMTGSEPASFVAGIAFAFSPFMFSHLAHVQVLAAGGIPLTFLFLERFFVSRALRDAVLLAAAMALQMLANGYYALFLALFVTLATVVHLLDADVRRDRRVWVGLGSAAALVAAVTGPFLLQYALVQKEMSLDRGIGQGARLLNYLATPSSNILYGTLTEPLALPERELFPGLVVAVLAALGVAHLVRGWRRGSAEVIERRPGSAVRVVDALSVIVAAVAVLVLVVGPVHFGPLSASSGARPLTLLLFLVALRISLTVHGRQRRSGRVQIDPMAIYLTIGVLAFLFTFGNDGPYPVLYRYVPGFNGIRALGRFNVVTSMVIALLAARGLAWLATRKQDRRRAALLSLLPVLLLVEFASMPIRQERVPVGGEIPSEYRFLAEHGSTDEAVLELPLPGPTEAVFKRECPRLYFSTVHWKPLVNGFSGFFPPLYDELRERWAERPLDDNLRDLEKLGVTWIVVHPSEPTGAALVRALRRRPHLVMRVAETPSAVVFRMLEGNSELARNEAEGGAPLPRDGWIVTAAVDGRHTEAVLDGDVETRWTSGPQEPGLWFQVEMPEARRMHGVRMLLGPSRRDFPRGWKVDVSGDGKHWSTAGSGTVEELPIASLADPRRLAVDLGFAPVSARFVRIALTARDEIIHWSIHEIYLLDPDGDSSPAG